MAESNLNFRLISPDEARSILDGRLPKTAETYHLRIRAGRALEPVTTPEERELARKWNQEHPRPPRVELVVANPRVAELRRLTNSRPHRCAAFGCFETIPGDQLMCEPHWALVPRWLQRRLNTTRDPAAATQWPIGFVERAIRATMTEADLSSVISRIESSHQSALALEVS